jgi:hypothetical protein
MSAAQTAEQQRTAGTICAPNRGPAVETTWRRIVRIRGDSAHPMHLVARKPTWATTGSAIMTHLGDCSCVPVFTPKRSGSR